MRNAPIGTETIKTETISSGCFDSTAADIKVSIKIG